MMGHGTLQFVEALRGGVGVDSWRPGKKKNECHNASAQKQSEGRGTQRGNMSG